MDVKTKKYVSKNLSYVLRHRPDSIGISLETGGWVDVSTLLAAFERDSRPISRELLELIVAECEKQRFELSEDGVRIRARQGHSVEVDLGYEPAEPPDVLYHGTAQHFLESVWQIGLVKGGRHHVHMSTNQETMRAVAMRKGKPVLIAIDSRRMFADGHEFFVTGNHVWLTDHVPVEYLAVV